MATRERNNLFCFKLAVLAITMIAVATVAGAVTMPPSTSVSFIATSGPDINIANGTYYSSNGEPLIFNISVPSDYSGWQVISVELFDPECYNYNPVNLDDGVNDTYFELRSPSGALIASQTYNSGTDTNLQYSTLATFTTRDYGYGNYRLYSWAEAYDVNNWSLQVTPDFSTSPTTSGDIQLSTAQSEFYFYSGSVPEDTYWFYVPEGTTSLQLLNFDLDNAATVTYFTPSGTSINGTTSGYTQWNDCTSTDPTNCGDVLLSPEIGWWAVTISGTVNDNIFVVETRNESGQRYPAFPGNVQPSAIPSAIFSLLTNGSEDSYAGATVRHPLEIINYSASPDYFEFDYTSSEGWSWEIYTDPNGDGNHIDGVLLTDTDSDGKLNVGSITSNDYLHFVAVASVPSTATTDDVTSFTVSSSLDSGATFTVERTTSIGTPIDAVKQLWLSGSNADLVRTPNTGYDTLRIRRNTPLNAELFTPFTDYFTISGPVTVDLWLDHTQDVNNDITCGLIGDDGSGTTLIGVADTVTVDGTLGPHLETFDFGSAVDYTLAPGSILILRCTSTNRRTTRLYYGDLTYPSAVNLNTSTVVNVNAVRTYDAPYPDGQEISVFDEATSVYVRAWVADPFGDTDVYGADIEIEPGVVVAMTEVASDAGGGYKIFEYEYPSAVEGSYTATVTGYEGPDGAVSDTQSAVFYVLSTTLIALKYFEAIAYDSAVAVTWESTFELENLGYNIYRRVEGQGELQQINLMLIPAAAGAVAGAEYMFIDLTAVNGERYEYYLEDIQFDFTRRNHGPLYASPAAGLGDPPEWTIDPVGIEVHYSDEQPTSTTTSDDNDSTTVLPAISTTLIDETAEEDSALDLQLSDEGDFPSGLAARKLFTDKGGVYRAGYDHLRATGLTRGDALDGLSLAVEGHEIAARLHDADESGLSESDYLEFIGRRNGQYLTARLAFWLFDGGAGLRPQVRDASPVGGALGTTNYHKTVRMEKDLYFLRQGERTLTEDPWFMEIMFNGSWGYSKQLSFDASDLSNAEENATLQIMVHGILDGEHEIKLALNDPANPVATVQFSGLGDYYATAVFDASLMVKGQNSLWLTMNPLPAGQYDSIYLDWTAITYATETTAVESSITLPVENAGDVLITGFTSPEITIYETSDPDNPLLIEGGIIEQDGAQYAIRFNHNSDWGAAVYHAFEPDAVNEFAGFEDNNPSDLHSTENGADYLIIAAPELVTATAGLADYRRQTGYEVEVIDLTDIYDEFSAGNPSLQAVRYFLNFAAHNWSPAPHYVVLVGDASYDHDGRLEQFGITSYDLLPSASVYAYSFYTPSDNWYAMFDGDDLIPDLAIGRIPARTPEQVAAVVEKIVSYETISHRSEEARKYLMALSDEDNFHEYSDSIMSYVPYTYAAVTEILNEGAATRDRLIGSINEGLFWLQYIGHGSVDSWDIDDTWTPYFSNDDIELLENSFFPIIVAMNCLNGYFNDPYYDASLAEKALLESGKGAAAYWTSSSITAPRGQALAAAALTRAVFTYRNNVLGDAILQALAAVADDYPYVVYSWVLFGDPALRLPVNQWPVARALADLYELQPGDAVNLSAGGSYDPDGDPLDYNWNYEWGPVADLAVEPDAAGGFEMVLDEPGTYLFSLKVGDGELISQTDEVVLRVIAPDIPIEDDDDDDTQPPLDDDDDDSSNIPEIVDTDEPLEGPSTDLIADPNDNNEEIPDINKRRSGCSQLPSDDLGQNQNTTGQLILLISVIFLLMLVNKNRNGYYLVTISRHTASDEKEVGSDV
jgi:Peptidase family C25